MQLDTGLKPHLKSFMPLKNSKNELQTTKWVLQSKLSDIIDYVTLSLYFL